jgi:hypothetical protein
LQGFCATDMWRPAAGGGGRSDFAEVEFQFPLRVGEFLSLERLPRSLVSPPLQHVAAAVAVRLDFQAQAKRTIGFDGHRFARPACPSVVGIERCLEICSHPKGCFLRGRRHQAAKNGRYPG